MIEIRKTEKYAQWLDGLRDIKARARIQARVERLATGKEMSSRWAKVSRSYGSITAPVIGYISQSVDAS